MKVIVTQRAKQNLSNIFDYNSNISLRYAVRIDVKIHSYIEDLEYFPYMGRYIPEVPNKIYRERICEKFRIIYFVDEREKIIIIRNIFNARQGKAPFIQLLRKNYFNF